MLIPHLLKIYFGLGWPSSVLEIETCHKDFYCFLTFTFPVSRMFVLKHPSWNLLNSINNVICLCCIKSRRNGKRGCFYRFWWDKGLKWKVPLLKITSTVSLKFHWRPFFINHNSCNNKPLVLWLKVKIWNDEELKFVNSEYVNPLHLSSYCRAKL